MQKQRNHKRLITPKGTPVLAGGGIGKILNISQGGVSVECVDDITTEFPKELILDLLSTENMIMAHQIPGKVVWEKLVRLLSPTDRVIRKIGVKFSHLTEPQKIQIKKIIMNFSKGAHLQI